MPRAALYILCGLPFSGKTTLALALADQHNCVHLDLDALASLKGFSPEEEITDKQWSLMFREAHKQLAALLSAGRSVVFDAVNYDRAGRDRLRAIAQENGSSVYIIYVKLPAWKLEQRRRANRDNHQRPMSEIKTSWNLPGILRFQLLKRILWYMMEYSK